MHNLVTVTEGDCWSRIRLEKPALGNALCPHLVFSIRAELLNAKKREDRLVIFEGEGRNFCTGIDLSEIDTLDDQTLLARFCEIELLLSEIWNAPFLTMAVGKGRVTGAGADLFTACDLRLSFNDSTFAFPGSSFGLVLGTRRLGIRVGADVATRLALSGAYIDARHACELGLVSKILTPSALNAEYLEAEEVVRKHTIKTVAQIKSAALSSYGSGTDNDMAALVKSASAAGLKNRILRYRDKVKKIKKISE